MKNLITAIPCTMILFALILQFVQAEVINVKINQIEQEVSVFRQEVRYNGGADRVLREGLREELSRIMNCQKEEVEVRCRDLHRQRGERVRYSIEVPFKKVVANPIFWGIKREDNSFVYRIERATLSEYLEEVPEEEEEQEEEEEPEEESVEEDPD